MFERLHVAPELERQPIMRGVMDLDEGPIDISLASYPMRIVEAWRDIKVISNVDCLVIDPATYSRRGEAYGYKGLRDGETIILGRKSDYGRFDFPQIVSREHVSISRSGNKITVQDLGSTNGTYHLLPYTESTDTAVTEPIETTQTESVRPEESLTGECRPKAKLERLGFKLAGSSIPSDRHPSRNEDAFLVDPKNLTIGVFDGVGGAPGSERAALLASEAVQAHLKQVPSELPRSLSHRAMQEAFIKAHRAIRQDPASGIATTATIARVFESQLGGPYAVVASAGDSRAYLLRDNNLAQLTLDHAYHVSGYSDDQKRVLQETLAGATDLSQLDEEALIAFKQRNILTSFLGGSNEEENLVITVQDFEVYEGDRLVITSDGVHDNLTSAEIENILQEHESIEVAMEAMIHAARLRSQDLDHVRAKPDDMTASAISL